jgi:hypothetical protein
VQADCWYPDVSKLTLIECTHLHRHGELVIVSRHFIGERSLDSPIVDDASTCVLNLTYIQSITSPQPFAAILSISTLLAFLPLRAGGHPPLLVYLSQFS